MVTVETSKALYTGPQGNPLPKHQQNLIRWILRQEAIHEHKIAYMEKFNEAGLSRRLAQARLKLMSYKEIDGDTKEKLSRALRGMLEVHAEAAQYWLEDTGSGWELPMG